LLVYKKNIGDNSKITRYMDYCNKKFITVYIKILYIPENRHEMTCKGICIRHKAQKPVGSGRYATGQKRCQICELFIRWDGLWCPCCGYRLRTRPRNLKYKAKLRSRREIEQANIVMAGQRTQKTTRKS
jgi:hypothetical protein